jgi:hypothetical protein
MSEEPWRAADEVPSPRDGNAWRVVAVLLFIFCLGWLVMWIDGCIVAWRQLRASGAQSRIELGDAVALVVVPVFIAGVFGAAVVLWRKGRPR